MQTIKQIINESKKPVEFYIIQSQTYVPYYKINWNLIENQYPKRIRKYDNVTIIEIRKL